MVSVKHVEKQNLRRVRLFLLIAALLALCFALSGCDEEGECIDGGEHDYVLVRENAWLLVIAEDETYAKGGDQFEPRCGDTGRYFDEYKCSKCGLYLDRANGKTGVKQHELEPWEQTKAATCTSAGVEKRKCSNRFYRAGDNYECDYSETRTVPALGHDYQNVEAKEPTCTEPGNTAGKKCKRCGHMHSGKVIPALGHDLVQHGAQAVTCTTVGWDAYVTCSRCNYSTYAEKAALGHDWGDAAYTWSDDYDECTARRVCKRDSSHYEDVTASATAADIPATCTEDAKTVYTATFGDPFATQTAIVTAEGTAAGHDWSDTTYSWSADLSACTASRVCARGHVETETAKAAVETTGNACTGGVTTYSVTFTNPAFVAQSDTVAFNGVGHSEEIIPGVAATCVKTGLSEGKICLVCWEFLVEQKETNKDPNNHEGPFVLGLNADVPSTCTTPGYHTEGICKACGVEVKTELPLDSDNHGKVVVLPAEPATCVSTGLTEGMKCAGCGKILVEQKETDKDPNNHEGPMALVSNADVPSTCTTPGYHTERICKACGVEVKTELPLDPDNHGKVVVLPAVPATCTQTGLTEGTKCAACGKVLSGLIETPVDPNNHDWGEWMQTKAPNCTEAGTETRSCGREGCEAKETREVAALGHTGTATCTAQAVCTRCNQPYGKALGHNWGTATYTWSADYSQCSAERECGRCHKGENATADALAEGTPATCEQAGKTTYTATFSDPFTTQTVNKETPALGHKGGTATCTAKAVCTRCNQPYGDPMGHDFVHHEAQAPTCTAPGWDTYDTCSRCDYTTTYAETPVDPDNHDWGEWMQTKAPNCTDPGEKTHTCQRTGCGATETEAIPAVEGAHVAVVDPAVAATCVEEGKTEGSHCSVCGKVLVEQTATEKNPYNHAALKIGDDAEPATCEKDGYTGTLYCTACGTNGEDKFISEGDIIPMLEHEYNDVGVCTRCGKSKEPEGVSGGNS